MKYDLSLLTDIEFQKLINQLVEKKNPGKTVEQFAKGPDGGVDGKIQLSPTSFKIIQSKHYLRTGYSGLKSQIEKTEISKIKKLNPAEYVLATSIDLSAGNSNELEKLIQDAIPNAVIEIWGYTTIEAQLDLNPDIVKATIKLWAQSVDVVKQILNSGAETAFMSLQRKWNKIDKYFVPFEKINKFTDVLNKDHVLIISGEPGIGKTTLAEHICKSYFINGFKIVIINNSSDLCNNIDLRNPEDPILFYYDDFLGSNYFTGFEGSFDRQLIDILREVKFHPKKRFILTSRTNIIEKGTFFSEEFAEYHLNDISIPIMSVDLNKEVKSKILYNHLWHSQLNGNIIKDFVEKRIYKDVIQHENFNPRLIEFITEEKNYSKSGDDYISFVKKSLDNPKAIWERCYTVQLNECQRSLIKLVVANGGSIEEKELNTAYNRALEIFRLVAPNNERTDYSYVLQICENSLLKRFFVSAFTPASQDEFRISTFNPSVNDFIIPLITNSFELEQIFKCLNSIGCIRFICSLKFDYKIGLLVSIIDGISVYNEIKLIALRELMKLSFSNAEKYIHEIIADESKSLDDTDIYYIVLESIDKIDCSDFISKHIENYIGYYDEIYQLYEEYFKSRFYEEKVGELIYAKFYKEMKESFGDYLHDDDEFNNCYTEKDGYDCLDGILNNYRYLKEDDRKTLFDSINMQKEIEYNNERDWDDGYESYENIKKDSSFNEDNLFMGLLER